MRAAMVFAFAFVLVLVLAGCGEAPCSPDVPRTIAIGDYGTPFDEILDGDRVSVNFLLQGGLGLNFRVKVAGSRARELGGTLIVTTAGREIGNEPVEPRRLRCLDGAKVSDEFPVAVFGIDPPSIDGTNARLELSFPDDDGPFELTRDVILDGTAL